RAARVSAALISGIGSLSHARLAWYDSSTMKYEQEDIEGSLEVASLSGNYVTPEEGSMPLHLHAVIGTKEKTWTGHLLEGTVSLNFEIVAVEIAGISISRYRDERSGINIIRE
ncbi:MAG: PPC domain-containing DNA-binding protein, partial [Thermoprotei archaeon]